MRLLLFSGGIESTCLALLHRPDLLLTINYGQICADGEARASSYIATELNLRHEILCAPLNALGAGDLAGRKPAVSSEATDNWPFRNQMLITLAAMRYEREGLEEIMIGTVASDKDHPDGSPRFIDAISHSINAQNSKIKVVAPALHMTTRQLVESSKISFDLLGWTFSCHRADVACGQCRGCNKSFDLFNAIGHPQGNLMEY